MTQVKVKVLRPLRGDKMYARGDTRMLAQEDADRLAATGAVEIVKAPPKTPAVRKAPPKKSAAKTVTVKKAAAPKNKKAAAPANKAQA